MLTEVQIREEKIQKRILWPDILRVFAILSVIVIHASAPVVYSFGKISMRGWMAANFYDSVTRACVPLFVMISGMMLLNPSKDEPAGVFFKKRLRKILIPFLFWGLVYVLWKIHLTGTGFSMLKVIKEFLTGSIYTHFWFIYMIIGLYLITPVLRQYIKHASLENQLYLISLWFICSSLFPLATKFFKVSPGLQIQMVTGYIGYFVLGYTITRLNYFRSILLPAYICLISGIIVTFLGTAYLSLRSGSVFDEFFYEYLSPSVVLMAAGIFTIFMNIRFELLLKNFPFIRNFIIILSEASFGVYFVHMLILEFLNRGLLGIKISGLSFNPLISIPATAFLTALISFVFVILLRKIPFIKHIF